MNGVQEAAGSIPIVSTKKRPRNGEDKPFVGLSFFVKKEWKIEKKISITYPITYQLRACL